MMARLLALKNFGSGYLKPWRAYCDFILSAPKCAVPDEPVKSKEKVFEMTRDEITESPEQNLVQLRKDFAKDEENNILVPVFKKAFFYADQVAVKDAEREYIYIQLHASAKRLDYQISNCGSGALNNVACICANDVLESLTKWACWMSGQVAMPLNMDTTPEEFKMIIKKSKPHLLIVSLESQPLVEELIININCPMLVVDQSFMKPADIHMIDKHRLLLPSIKAVLIEDCQRSVFYDAANALLLYRRQANGKPKGVMLAHKNLDRQAKGLIKAWKISSYDCFLHPFASNNASGYLGAYLAVMCVGTKTIIYKHFTSTDVWNSLFSTRTPSKDHVSVFMATPIMYEVSLDQYERSLGKQESTTNYVLNKCREHIRLMVIGTTPISQNILRRWYEITSHRLLQCYGPADTGVVLSDKYDVRSMNVKESDAGKVGLPLPDVRMRFTRESSQNLLDCYGVIENDEWVVKFVKHNESTILCIENQEKSYDFKVQKTEDLVKAPSANEDLSPTKMQLQLRQNSLKPNVDNEFDLSISLNRGGIPLFELTYKGTGQLLLNEFLKHVLDTFAAEVKNKNLDSKKLAVMMDAEANQGLTGHAIYGMIESGTDSRSAVKINSKSKENSEAQEFKKSLTMPEVNGKEISGFIELDGLFKTGDLAVYENGGLKIVKQSSDCVPDIARNQAPNVDLESLKLEHPSIKDATIVSMPVEDADNQLKEGLGTEPQYMKSLKRFCAKCLPSSLLPQWLKVVNE